MIVPFRLAPLRWGWLLVLLFSGPVWAGGTPVAGPPPRQLHQSWHELVARHVLPDGRVNYQGFLDDEEKLSDYLQLLARTVPDERTWTPDERKAYWLNVYNASTVALVLEYYPLASLNDVRLKSGHGFSPWDALTVVAGGREYSLNQVERQQLRDQFHDPLIHFALVYGAVSSPMLRNEAYEGSRLNAQLADQARRFLADPLLNSITENQARLSSLFDWYSAEFGADIPALIAFLNRYLHTPLPLTAQVEFLPFDWRLNDKQALSGTQALTR